MQGVQTGGPGGMCCRSPGEVLNMEMAWGMERASRCVQGWSGVLQKEWMTGTKPVICTFETTGSKFLQITSN